MVMMRETDDLMAAVPIEVGGRRGGIVTTIDGTEVGSDPEG